MAGRGTGRSQREEQWHCAPGNRRFESSKMAVSPDMVMV